MDRYRLGGHPLADGGIFVLKETVQNAAGPGAVVAHTHKTYQLCRVYLEIPCLLRDNAEGAEHGGVVNLVAYSLTLEINI